tara:strand:- start:536 stop:766 length:231 start_codon:yes stop_codon:yes gene_type:complete
MTNKGFTDITDNINTPKDINQPEKPLKDKKSLNSRVDINILKSKLQESEDKEFKKNMFILSFLVLGLGTLGIYFSL